MLDIRAFLTSDNFMNNNKAQTVVQLFILFTAKYILLLHHFANNFLSIGISFASYMNFLII